MMRFLKMLFYILLFFILLVTILIFYIRSNMGNTPSLEEEAKFEKLSYYKDGRFITSEPMKHDLDNVRNGPAGFTRMFRKSRFAPKHPLPQIELNKDSFPDIPENYTIYWLGHSSAIVELNGKRLIFDPVFNNAAPIPFAMQRYGQAPIKRKNLPPLDYIVITHNHYDHLEKKTIKYLKSVQGHFIVPLGLGATLRGWGIKPDRITELGWNDTFEKDGISITALESRHYSRRGFRDYNKTLWASYILKSPSQKIFWSGDTGYGKHFVQIGKDHGPFDLAVIEIDGWNPGWPNAHMFPNEVVKAALELRANRILPVHWAVFDLALHPWHESIDMLLEEIQGKPLSVQTPKMGEKLIPGETPTQYWWRAPLS